MRDLADLERLAKAAESTAPSPWGWEGGQVRSPSARGWLWRVAAVNVGGRDSNEVTRLGQYMAALSPAVVLGLVAAERTTRAALTELLAALDDSANPPDKDDVRAMLRYGKAEEAARALLAQDGGRTDA